ncbi:DegT/DnrJ/EryC1/StrS family aminotransferase, partial [bacterium]|nr:DegT/DnrJ/EryC1/StrS family aminotransferase [bacterium]
NNLEPLYIDITEGSYNMSLEDLNEKITDNTKVLILQHTFGVLADKRIIDFCKQRGILVLEDCAHTLGNTNVGNWGDATMLSFGIEKMLPTRVGGALIVNNPELIAGVVGKYSEIKSISKWESFKWMINPLLWRCIRLVPEPFTSGAVWILKRIGLLKSGFSVSENQGVRFNLTVKDITQVLAKVVVDCLVSINTLLLHRKQLTGLYSRELGLNLSGPLVRYPYVPESKEYVDRLIRSIAQLGYPFYDKWFCPVVFPKATNLQKMKYIKGSCPVAEKTSEMIVNLPTGLNVSESKAMDIVNLIKSQKQL